MKRSRAIALGVVAVGVAAAGVVASIKPASSGVGAEPARAVMTVTPVRLESADWPQTISASGNIVAWHEAIIAAETGGLRITALHADVGDRVKRGQVLAELARDTVQADLRRYTASQKSAEASLAKARKNAERASQLKGSGSLSDEQIDDYLIAEQTAQADFDLAAAQLDAQRITLAQTRIVAVDDGVISSRPAILGQVVSSGTELFRLQRQGRLDWQAEVDARQLSRVQPGAKAAVTLPDGRTLDGQVRLISPTLSTSTSRANVLVALAPGAAAGMFASGSIEAGRQSVHVLPQTALVLRDGISYVFELGADDRVVRRRVDTGRQRDGRVEIVAGLQPEARVVAAGGGFLSDGAKVKVAGEQR